MVISVHKKIDQFINLYATGMTALEVSLETECHVSTVAYQLRKLKLLRTAKDAHLLAGRKGRKSHRKKGIPMSEEAKKNMSISKLTYWKNRSKGFSLKPSGYIEITTGKNKGRGQHRVIAEKMIGRKLIIGEVVHHIDGNRSNNNKSNLQVMASTDHLRLHALENNSKRKRDSIGRYI